MNKVITNKKKKDRKLKEDNINIRHVHELQLLVNEKKKEAYLY